MFQFFKRNIIYLTIIVTALEVTSFFINNMNVKDLWSLLIVIIFSVLLFFIDCKLCRKGYISERDFFVLLGVFFSSLLFCILSFIKKETGFQYLFLGTSSNFITEFILIKIFDIKLQ